jgi:ketosteroid isomerase-like protein
VSEESTTADLEEALRRSIEAFNRRDFDAVMTIYTPDAVWDNSDGGLGVYEGRDAVRGFLEDWRRPYEDFEQAVEEFRDLGNGVTFGVGRQRARLPGSGFVEVRYAGVAIWRDGLIERFTVYATDIDEARAAAERLAEERG